MTPAAQSVMNAIADQANRIQASHYPTVECRVWLSPADAAELVAFAGGDAGAKVVATVWGMPAVVAGDVADGEPVVERIFSR